MRIRLLPSSATSGRRRDTAAWPRFQSLLALAVVILLAATSPASAQKLTNNQLKTGSAVKNAFKEVVATPRNWTVRIKADGKDKALGTIIDSDGWVLTKASELKGKLTCRLTSGKELPARIVGVHRDFDVAMLKIDATNLPTVDWRTGGDPAVGQWLATPGTGNVPVGVGVVSVKRRKIPKRPGILGIIFAEDSNGPKITEILPNSGAAKAGLKKGDIVKRVAGKAVNDGNGLRSMIKGFRPGDTLLLRVLRGENQLDLHATLGYQFRDLFNRNAFMQQMGGKLSTRRAGFPTILQHDTILRPQDCGGPIVDLNGKAIGINIARAGRTKSFAIPADELRPLFADLKSGKLAPPLEIVHGATEPPPPPLPEG